MNIDQTKDAFYAIARILECTNWESLERHSADDLTADADDAAEIARLANLIENNIRHFLTYPKEAN